MLQHEDDRIDVVEKHCGEAMDKMKKSLEEMDRKMKLLKAMKEDLDKTREEMRVNAEEAKSKIVFDVGGQRFATTKETLMSQPDTYFTAMLGSDRWKVSPLYFIINHLDNDDATAR